MQAPFPRRTPFKQLDASNIIDTDLDQSHISVMESDCSSLNLSCFTSKSGSRLKKRVNIVVKFGEGKKAVFRMKRKSPFSKLFASFCKRFDITPKTCRFIFDGDALKEHETPFLLEFSD